MDFDQPLLPATLVRRYKRFLADVVLADGTPLTVHCPNSGAMTTCAKPGMPVLLSDSQNPKRKLRYTWELICMDGTWVGVNTINPNKAVSGFVAAQCIPELAGYAHLRREVSYGSDGKSRIDVLLSDGQRSDCYVEIKNATMRVGAHAAFPDAVTSRGQKHLEALMHVRQRGERAVIFFFIGRSDCARFRPADEVDPRYGVLLREAVATGVEVLAYRMAFDPHGVRVLGPAPVDV